jgi:hypothetical protein
MRIHKGLLRICSKWMGIYEEEYSREHRSSLEILAKSTFEVVVSA